MRIVFFILLLVFGASGVDAQPISARIMSVPDVQPANVTLFGPVGATYPTENGPEAAVPIQQPGLAFFDLATPVPGALAATANEGETEIMFAGQTLALAPRLGSDLLCGFGRPCQMLSVTSPSVPEFALDAFMVTLDAPVPDPDGGCLIVSGQALAPIPAENLAVPVELIAMPVAPPPLPSGLPAAPAAPLPETHLIMPPTNVVLVFGGSLQVEFCGDVEETDPGGRLEYTMHQAGTDWSWDHHGAWTFEVDGRTVVMTHETLSTSVTGLLLDSAEGAVGPAEADVIGSSGDLELNITPDPGIADPVRLTFQDRVVMGAGGGERVLEVNHPGVIALSYLFRHYQTVGHFTLPETDASGEVWNPANVGPGPNGAGLSLELHWTRSD